MATAKQSLSPNALLILSSIMTGVNTKDTVAESTKLKPASVQSTVKNLADKGFVKVLKDKTYKVLPKGERAHAGPPEPRTDTKMAKAREIFLHMYAKHRRGEIITAFVDKLGMSEAGASTYISMIKKREEKAGTLPKRELPEAAAKPAKKVAAKKAAKKATKKAVAKTTTEGAPAGDGATATAKPKRVRKPAAKKAKAAAPAAASDKNDEGAKDETTGGTTESSEAKAD